MKRPAASRILRALRWPALVLLVAVLGAGGWLYRRLNQLTVEQLTPDVYVIRGLGGNVGVLATGAQTVIVDSMTFPLQGRKIQQTAQALTGQPVGMVINTHYHADHAHGNPGFPAATRVISTRRTRELMVERDAGFWAGDNSQALPDQTIEAQDRLVVGSKTLVLLHPGRGHTDGDLIVLFVEDGVVHMGDLYFNQHYPNIDLAAGGSVRRWVDSLGLVFELPFDKVIPGHGDTSGPEGLIQFHQFMQQLAWVVEDAARNGWTRAETLEQARLDEDLGYRPMRIPFVVDLDREFVLGRAWEEAQTVVPAKPAR